MAVLGGVLAACASDPETPDLSLQMNDVSVLMPLPRSSAELGVALSATTPGRGGVLLPEALFQNDKSAGPIEYAALRVIAFRLDPCFGTTDPHGHADRCENQLRIIFQPLRLDADNHPVADDAAVHAFYRLTREELLAAVQEVADARLADAGADDLGPLAPHPTIVREGLSGTLAQSFDHILAKYAGEANLVRFTSFVFLGFDVASHGAPLVGIEQFWTMHGTDLATGQPRELQIGGMPEGTVDVGLGVAPDPLSTRISPDITATDNLTVIADMAAAQEASASVRQQAFDAALRIEHPAHHTPDTTDCASCHMAQPARELVAAQLGLHADGNVNAFVAAAFIPAADLATTTQLIGRDGGLNMHAFSYRADEPMINQRVINETAANLALLRELRE